MNRNRRAPLGTVLAACLLLAAGCQKRELIIRTPEDAAHARVGVMTGSTGEVLAKNRFPESRIQSYDSIPDTIAALSAGNIDAVVAPYSIVLLAKRCNPDLDFVDAALSNEDTAVAVRKGDNELLAAVNGIIESLRADGTLDSMNRRWMKTDNSPYEPVNVETVTTGTPLRIGVASTLEPFCFLGADGQITGHAGELARRVGLKLGRPVQFFDMRFPGLIPALQGGKIDLIVTGMSATDERRKFVDFSTRYYANKQVFLIRRTNAAPQFGLLRTPQDLRDKRIGVLMGSAHDSYATANFPKARIQRYQGAADVTLAVRSGKVDAALFDGEPLRDVLREDDTLAIFGDPLFSFPVAAGFRKESTDLHGRFNAFLDKTKTDGTQKEMESRWMQRRERTMQPIEAPTAGQPLRVGIANVGVPFVFMENGEWRGFEIEIVQRFGAAQGRPVQFVSMDFGALIAALQSEKVDLIVSAIYVTAERQKRIQFSDPYFEMDTVLFARKSQLAAFATESVSPGSASLWRSLVASFRSNLVEEKRYLLLADGLKTTVLLSILSAMFGTLLGGAICALRLSKWSLARAFAGFYITLLRGTPVLVLLMILFYVVFAKIDLNPVLVAVMAFGMNFGAYSAEIFRTGIEGVDRGQGEAAIALGFTRLQSFRHIILSQALRRILPVFRGEFISLVKMTSIVGYIAVQDLAKASDIIRSRTFDAFFPLLMVAALYFIISWLLMQGLVYLERRLDPKSRRVRA